MLYIYTDAKLKYDFVQTIVSLQFNTDLRKVNIIMNKIALQNVTREWRNDNDILKDNAIEIVDSYNVLCLI